MRNIIVDAMLIYDPYRYEEFKVICDKKNYRLIRKKLESERDKIVSYLKRFKHDGLIKSVKIPKNKRMQKQLNELVRLKKMIDRSIDKIKEFYYK
jgi:hypothetical protein